MRKHTIAIVDDHLLFAQSLKGLINTFDGFEVIHEANNGQEFIDTLSKTSNLPKLP